MDKRRLYIIRIICVLFIVLFMLLLSVARADNSDDARRDHKLILQVADEIDETVDDLQADDEEHLELLRQVSLSKNTDVNPDDYEDYHQFEAHPYDEPDSAGEELLVEDDAELELEPAYSSEKYKTGSSFSPDYQELPHCEQAKTDLPRSIVVVSTLDGRLTSLDLSNGEVLWSHEIGKNSEMLSSSMSKLEVTSRGDLVRLIPSLDGGIYRCDGDVVEALPITAETLLHSSFKFNADTIFTGGKSTEVWGVASKTGRVQYICSASGCKRRKSVNKPEQLLVVKRVTQTVRAVDPKSGDERWNFSVGQHEVNIAGGGCQSVDTTGNIILEEMPSLHFIVPEGIVMGMDPESQLRWQQKLASPVVSAWKLLKGELKQIDLFSTNTVPALTPDSNFKNQGEDEQQPDLYVGVHRKQLYIQQSGGMRSKFNTAFKIFSSAVANEGGSGVVSFPRVHWRPYLATALSRTPVVNIDNSNKPLLIDSDDREENTAVAIPHHIDYPYDNGFYLYGEEGSAQNYSGPWEAPVLEDESIISEVTSHIVAVCFQIGPNTWLKMACGIVFYFALHFFLIRWIFEHMKHRLMRQASEFITIALYHIVNNPRIIPILQGMGVQLPQLPAPPPPPPPLPPTPPPPSSTPPLTPSAPSKEQIPLSNSTEELNRSDSTFVSRYQTDFKPIQCLGRGGFGVVFEVYNNLDENKYAIKRITLPSKEASAERVKREVRALAKLNHTNIVRYYNSWLESPPPGWQDETELLLQSWDPLSNSIFTPDEETHEKFEDKIKHPNDKSSKESVGNLVKKEHNPLVADYLSPFIYENDDGDGSEDDNTKDNELESSNSSSEEAKPCSSVNFQNDFNDDSEESIVFENSTSGVHTKSNEISNKDFSEGVFEPSVTSSQEMLSNNQNISNLNKSDDSDFITFKNFTQPTKNGMFVRTTQDSKSELSSHSNSNQNFNDYLICDKNKRKRLQSQPAGSCGQSGGGERPRTLSLRSSIDEMSKIKSDPHPRPKTYLYIQMELCQKESLKDWLLKHNEPRQDKLIYSIFNDIVRAVEYVHDNQMMHRDLKPNNIFFSLGGEIKIGDFGLVTTITEEEQQEIRTPAEISPCISSNHHTRRVGTQLYMSPEQIHNKVYDYKVDIYSLGLIFFEMLVPFSTVMERLTVMSAVREGKFPEGFCAKYPSETELLKLMLSVNPVNRLTTRGIRARSPLRELQGSSVDDIQPEDHFRLNRQRSHQRSNSGSSFSFTSSSSS